jgi:hypothetical protein
MGERGQIALQREGLVAATTRLTPTAVALMVNASRPRLSLARTFSPSVGCPNHSIPQHVPAYGGTINMGLCGYNCHGEAAGALPRHGSSMREMLQ